MHLDGTLDPLDTIHWVAATSLRANNWNPNVVMQAEFTLLERSILETGWMQPLLASRECILIDGYHRWRMSQDSSRLQARYGGQVPVVLLDVTEAAAMLMTVRINRAKGTHGGLRMSELVRTLIDTHGLKPLDIQRGIGASKDEVDLLYKGGVFKARDIANHTYSKSWAPGVR